MRTIKVIVFLSVVMGIGLFSSYKPISRLNQVKKTESATAAKCTLKVAYTQTYCGGARPSQVMLDTLAQPKPLVQTTIVLLNGKKKIKVKTDSKGRAVVDLRTEVNTCYSLTKQIDASIPQINRTCKKALNMSYGSFVVGTNGTREIELVYNFTCDPCDPNSKKRQ